jgi:hypothetical protein
MKKLILFLIITLTASVVFAQETPPPSQYLKTVNGQFYMDTRDSSIWQYMGTPYGWQKKARFKDILLYGDTKFSNNLTVYLPPGYTFGKYGPNTVIPSIGKTAAEVIEDAIKVTIPFPYLAPTSTLSGNPTSTVLYEIGTILNISLNASFTQNNGGSLIGTTYYRGSTALAGNTDAITLTSPISYSTQQSYGQGNCLPNNQNNIDCTGRINSGTTTSNNITYTPGFKRYAVWLSDTTGIKTTGFNDALITNAGTAAVNQISSSKVFSFSTGAATNKFLAIVYVSSAGALTSIKINGVGSIGAFNSVTRNLTNAQGYPVNVRIYYNTQAQTTTGYDIDTQ